MLARCCKTSNTEMKGLKFSMEIRNYVISSLPELCCVVYQPCLVERRKRSECFRDLGVSAAVLNALSWSRKILPLSHNIRRSLQFETAKMSYILGNIVVCLYVFCE